MEYRCITEGLELANWNVSKDSAAGILGLKRSTLLARKKNTKETDDCFSKFLKIEHMAIYVRKCDHKCTLQLFYQSPFSFYSQ